jgi:DNA-binding PadR family transcriptional regulator
MPAYLGEFEQLVLLALLRLGADAYGISVRQEIARRTGRVPSLGTVYAALNRLEQKRLVAAYLGDPTPERGGRRKKHYTVLPAGRRALNEALRSLRRLAQGISPALGLP